MATLRRYVAGSPGRPTRAHTLRGTLIEPAAWLDVPKALLQRVSRRTPIEPWIAPRAAGFLEPRVGRATRVLEFGAGRSTLWFARRAGFVLSFESDVEWHDWVVRSLEAEGLSNARVELVPLDGLVARALQVEPSSFDVILVDHADPHGGERMRTLRVVQALAVSAGLVILDNSDRPAYGEADVMMAGWGRWRFDGFLSRPLQATETTIYGKVGDPWP